MELEHRFINFEDAKKILDSNDDCYVVDVREENEFLTGHVENAILFPVDTICEEEADFLINSKDTTLIVCCKTGKRSGMAYERLWNLGYRNIYDLGSLVGWPYGFEY